jgi:vacuolar-type H+-ATPase subunit C/Vma6
MPRGDAIAYGFATGRVMVLRSRLLGHAAFERLIDAPTFEDQKRVLSDTHFGKFVEHARTASDVEQSIDESLLDLFDDFLRKAELPAAVVDTFMAPYDFASLKSVLRARVLGVEPGFPEVRLGALEPEDFVRPEALPGALGQAARTVLDADPPMNAEQVDAAVDAAMFGELARLAKVSRIPLMERLATRQIDAANAKVLLRCAEGGRTPEESRGLLVPGGAWNALAAADLVDDPQALAEAIVAAKVLGHASAEEMLDLERLDVLVDATTATLAREAARGPIGPQPVLGYVLQRRAEAITVRALLVGRLAGLPRDVIVSRLREVAS